MKNEKSLSLTIKVRSVEEQRAINDLMLVYYSDTYINIKGYLQKLIDNLYHFGYYRDNETLFPKGEL